MPVDRMEQIISVFGSFDRNIHIVEDALGVRVVDRESELHISGDEEAVMVKDDRHRTRALIYSSGQEVGIDGNPAVFALVGNIQEETHRFAIEYHRSLRTASIGSALENIPGVGEKRRNELLKQFKTVKAIREASVDELAAVVPKSTAKAVWEHFHREETKTETTEDSI